MSEDYKITQLEELIGPRGAVVVTAKNRGLVRKWLTAKGIPASKVVRLTVEDMQGAYNDKTEWKLNHLTGLGEEPVFKVGDKVWVNYVAEEENPFSSVGARIQPGEEGEVVRIEFSQSQNCMCMSAKFNDRVWNFSPECLILVEPEPEEAEPTTPEKEETKMTDVTEALKVLTQALSAGNNTAVDEARVKEIVNQAVKEHVAKPMVIKLKNVDTTIPAGEHRHEVFETVLKAITCGNVALVGPAGAGKTTLAEQVAHALGVKFYFCGAINSEYKLTGFIDAQGRVVRTAFREAYEHGGLFLFDEVDGSSPNALLAFNAALANGVADFPDCTVPKHKDFYCMAAANTFWTGQDRVYVGRNQLDGATLDRFIFVTMDYDEKLERILASNDEWVDQVQKIREKAKTLKIRHIVSPRASIMGAKLLSLGMPKKDVLNISVMKGLDPDSVAKLLG